MEISQHTLAEWAPLFSCFSWLFKTTWGIQSGWQQYRYVGTRNLIVSYCLTCVMLNSNPTPNQKPQSPHWIGTSREHGGHPVLQLREFASFFLVNKRAPVVFGSEGYTLGAHTTRMTTVTTRMITFFNSRSQFFNWYWVGGRSKVILYTFIVIWVIWIVKQPIVPILFWTKNCVVDLFSFRWFIRFNAWLLPPSWCQPYNNS